VRWSILARVRGHDEPAARLGELLRSQALRWSQRSLVELCGPAAGPFVLDAALAELWAAHPEVVARVDGRAAARAIVRWLQARQQFLVVDVAVVEAMVGRALAGGPAAVEGLRVGLAELVRGQMGQVVEVVCSEYSPGLQLQLLGLAEVRGPALDVGCGASRGLVTELQARGVAAEGIDRVHGDDWLTYAYGVDRWGSVVSHHGFSLHFLHHHLRPGEAALAYARVYMDILRSLMIGGVFAYAPGLPFLEAMLPTASYRVVRVPLPADALAALQALKGPVIGHATQVWRRI
jgi:hypothetical protein